MYIGNNHILAQQQVDNEGGGFTTEYQAVLDEATTQGYTLPGSTVQDADDAMIVTMKADGNWSKMLHFWKFATDGDSDFAQIDWMNPTADNDFTDTGGGAAATYSTTGITAGGGSYVDIGITFDAAYTLNDASWILDIVTEQTGGSGSANTMIVEATDSGSNKATRFYNADSQTMQLNGGPLSLNRDTMHMGGTGFFTFSRNALTVVNCMLDASHQTGSPENHESLNLSDNLRLFVDGSTEYTAGAELRLLAIGTNINGEESDIYNALKI